MSALSLIALHGNGGGGHRFSRLRFTPDVAFHALTLPGFADRPRDPALASLADYAAWVARELEGIPRPRVLLGHGIGGSIALELLRKQAHAIDGLILHAPVGADLDRRWFPWLMSLPGARAAGQWLFSSELTRPLFARLLFTQPVPRDFLDRFFDEYRQCQVFGQMFDLITARWFASLEPTVLPSAILWGRRERVLAAAHAPQFQKLLPGARIHVIDGWDHFPMIEQPEEYAREVGMIARSLT